MAPLNERVLLPDEGAEVRLNPMERTLYRLFLKHPEGLSADALPLHWQELEAIYAQESCFVDEAVRERTLASLCAESKKVFYTTVSRIKRQFVKAVGGSRAKPYYIARDKHGVYKTRATASGPFVGRCLLSDFRPRRDLVAIQVPAAQLLP